MWNLMFKNHHSQLSIKKYDDKLQNVFHKLDVAVLLLTT